MLYYCPEISISIVLLTKVTASFTVPHPLQMGNAVAPPVASALGRCLALAVQTKSPVAQAVICVPDPEYEAMLIEARAKGLKFYSEEHQIDDVSGFQYR